MTPLTTRQRQVLEELWNGCSNKQIAHRLGIALKTAEFHRTNINRRMGTTNSMSMIRKALEQGLVRVE